MPDVQAATRSPWPSPLGLSDHHRRSPWAAPLNPAIQWSFADRTHRLLPVGPAVCLADGSMIVMRGRRFLRFAADGTVLADRMVPRATRQYRLVHQGDDQHKPVVFIPTGTGLSACNVNGCVQWRLRIDGAVSYSLAPLADGQVGLACMQVHPSSGQLQVRVAVASATHRVAWSRWTGPLATQLGLWAGRRTAAAWTCGTSDSAGGGGSTSTAASALLFTCPSFVARFPL